MRSKCFIQRCKTVMLCNGSAFKFPIQFLRFNSRGNLSVIAFELLYQLVLFCAIIANIIGKRASIYVEITKYTVIHAHISPLRVSLQSIFYTLALIFVFDVNIYSSCSRLFKSDPVVSLLPATHRQLFILALSLPFR
jgi:hypothetical protein